MDASAPNARQNNRPTSPLPHFFGITQYAKEEPEFALLLLIFFRIAQPSLCEPGRYRTRTIDPKRRSSV